MTASDSRTDPHGHGAHGGHDHDEHVERGHGHHDHDEHDEQGHGHDHHGHGHHGHTHGISASADFRLLGIALSLLVSFMLLEVVVGVIAHSMALITDAGHMVTDVAALAVGMYVTRLVQREANDTLTYGYKRFEVLSGFGNGLTMLLLAAFLAYETIMRLLHPVAVHGLLVIIVGSIGVAINVAATFVTSKANRESMNIEGSFQHMLTDTYAFIGTVIAGILILVTGINQFDSIMSLIVAGLMIRGGYPLVKDAAKIFLQVTPEGISIDAIEQEILALHGIVEVHCTHVFAIVPGFPVFTVNVIVDDDAPVHILQNDIQRIARERGLHHHTIQMDPVSEGVQAYKH